MKGYYSLIQNCPDPCRAESVNVGVLVFCPSTGFLEARLAEADPRAVEQFRLDPRGAARLQEMKATLAERLTRDRERLQDLESLTHFIATRANKLQMTPLRNVRLTDPASDLDRLFRDHVEGVTAR